ncbi:MAG: phage major tail protein, TP901-1 family [Anaerovoracaceae bacterium]
MASIYCNFESTAAQAMAGKDILLCVFDNNGDNLLAIAGQQSFTLNRSAESIDTTSKDTQGGWMSKTAGMKEWSIDSDGIYTLSDQSHSILSKAFENGDPVCIKVVNLKQQTGMFGGLAVITDYPIEAPYDDSVTYSITLEGVGALVNLMENPEEPDIMPEGTAALGKLTVVSVEGKASGKTAIYVNPVLGASNKYFYKTGLAPLAYPAYGETISATAWDGSAEISADAGQQVMIIETDSANKALKAGVAMAIVAD